MLRLPQAAIRPPRDVGEREVSARRRVVRKVDVACGQDVPIPGVHPVRLDRHCVSELALEPERRLVAERRFQVGCDEVAHVGAQAVGGGVHCAQQPRRLVMVRRRTVERVRREVWPSVVQNLRRDLLHVAQREDRRLAGHFGVVNAVSAADDCSRRQ